MAEGDHTLIVEFSVKEFDDGAEINATSARMVQDQDYTALVMRLMVALTPPSTTGGDDA
jgi:hypothetical protein